MHISLQPRTDIIAILVSGLFALSSGYIVISLDHSALWLLIVGAVAGCCAGYLQLVALRSAGQLLLRAQSALEIRRALQTSAWGKNYFRVFWACQLLFLVMSALLLQVLALLGLIAAYTMFCVARDLVTL